MEIHELLKLAIETKKPIRFHYPLKDGDAGPRIGSPHVLYAHPTTRNVSCDIHQHSGTSDSGNIVQFKPFNLSKMTAVSIVEDEAFVRYEGYDFDAPRYSNALTRIP